MRVRPRRRTRPEGRPCRGAPTPPGRRRGRRGSASRSPTLPAAPARTSRTATAARRRRCPRRSRASARRSARRAASRDPSARTLPRTRESSASPARPARRGNVCPAFHARSAARSRSTVPFSTLLFARCPITTSSVATPHAAERLRSPPVHSAGSTPNPCSTTRSAGTPSATAASRSARVCTNTRSACVQQPAQVRLRVLRAGAVVRVGRVAEVQERREQERHPAAPREPQPARDRERVRERRGVDRVERAGVPVRVPPHRRADRVARRRQALPGAMRQQRQRLEDVAASGEVQGSVAVETHPPAPSLKGGGAGLTPPPFREGAGG